MNRASSSQRADRWQRIAGWFLVLSYIVGSPLFAFVEARTGIFSERFGYSPAFLHLVSAAQVVCASVLFVRSLAPWSSAILTVLALGAVVSHLRINSPLTALPALAYALLQIWYGIRVYRSNSARRINTGIG